jgi:ZIP family zinc transporter
VAAAAGWGALAASSLVIGALLGLARRWPQRTVGVVLAFGAGALISALSFELAAEGARVGGVTFVAIGLAAGALVYYGLDRAVDRAGSGAGARHPRGGARKAAGGGAGPALALGAFLDGIPEQAVLGIGLAGGEPVSAALLVAIFVSNLPEAIGSATEMRAAGRSPGTVRRLWVAVAAVCALATVAGYALADAAGGEVRAGIDGFAAGALLVMLVDSMIPEASGKGGRIAGLVTTLGFAVAAGLSSLS